MIKSRRCSKRWLDGDCPKGVLAIFDDPRTFDRYMVIYSEPIADDCMAYIGMSAAPFHPQGFGQHGEMRSHEVASYRYHNKHHYCRWSDLPEDCKRAVQQDLTP